MDNSKIVTILYLSNNNFNRKLYDIKPVERKNKDKKYCRYPRLPTKPLQVLVFPVT